MKNIFEKQREYFRREETKSYKFRMKALKKLLDTVKSREIEIYRAFEADFGKSSFEVYMTEMGAFYKSTKYILRNLKEWMKYRKVKTSLLLKPAKSFMIYEPLGQILVITPSNYPLLLALEPLASAISAGNTVIVKLSERTPNISNIIKVIIEESFDESFVYAVIGDENTGKELLEFSFDKIFFTGSSKVGKEIMKKASEHLTPVILELGGKSPAIVSAKADVRLSAQRIAKGKLINAGQTCIAPDYVLVEKRVEKQFLLELKKAFVQFFGENPIDNLEYTKIIDKDYMNRLVPLIEQNKDKIYFGGKYDVDRKYIQPTIIVDSEFTDTIMKEEIFAPILPVISYEDFDVEVIDRLKRMDKPLGAYIFTKNKKEIDKFINSISFGGGTINDTLLHFANENLFFGGVGNSGIGGYHGKYSFEAFSHNKSILKRPSRLQIDLIKPPYKHKLKLYKKLYR